MLYRHREGNDDDDDYYYYDYDDEVLKFNLRSKTDTS